MVVSSCRKRSSKPLPARVVVGVGGAPGFVGGLGDDPQPVQVRPRFGCFEEDLVGVLLQVLVADLAGPGGHLPRPGGGDGAVGGGVVEHGVAGQEAHLADGGLGVFAAQAGAAGEPGGGGGVAVAVVGGLSVEPPQHAVLRRAQPGHDRPERDQGLPAGGAVEVAGGRGVEVVDGRPGGAQRLRHAREPRVGAAGAGAVVGAHAELPPSRDQRVGLMALRRRCAPGPAAAGGLPSMAVATSSAARAAAGYLLPSRLPASCLYFKCATKIIYSKILILV
jgi:hypothetical protein